MPDDEQPVTSSGTGPGAGGELDDPEPDGPQPGASAPQAPTPFRPRRLADIVGDLWHPKPGSRQAGAASRSAQPTKEVVEGLSPQERMLGIVATVLCLVITVVGYFADKHSHVLVYHREADSLLLAGLVGAGLLALGTALRRRALLGFASFIVGMELISFAGVEGIVFLAFGGWLIVRVMRKQKQDQAAGTSRTRQRRPRHDAASRPGKPPAPAASKRYTPPRRARAASGRRR